MGTINWSIAPALHGVVGGGHIQSGNYTSSGTASYIDDGGTDIALEPEQVVQVISDTAMRLTMSGVASSTAGHYVPANSQREFAGPGRVSVVDV